MPPERLSRDEKKALTRQALLKAAGALIAHRGAEATSLDQIAEEAGYTKGAVYSNFSGKEELLFALAESAGTTIEIGDVIDGSTSLIDQLGELGAMVAREGPTVSRTAWRLHLEVFQFALRNPRARTRVAAEERSGRQRDGRYLDDLAARRGESLPMTGEELVTVLSALTLGLVQKQAIDPESVPDDLFVRAFRLLAGDQ